MKIYINPHGKKYTNHTRHTLDGITITTWSECRE